MNKTLTVIKSLAALAVAFAVSNLASANPISGGIAFNGTPTFINGDTAVTFSGTSIGGENGDFTGVVANPGSISFSTVIFNPLTVPSGDLWQFWDGGVHYTFSATTIDFASPPSQPVWDLSGEGYFNITGGETNFTQTDGTWSITFSQNNILSFEATAGTGNVPDGGTTALLVGLGLVGLGVYARRSLLAKS